ncbi:MAG TPA: hydroxyisourate hydrolase [Candidatus Baltobacteraceae bacterium]
MTLSTHVLDTSRGKPAAGIEVVLYALEDGQRREAARGETNASGRIASPFGAELQPGEYELAFNAGGYFAASGQRSFFEWIPVRFRIDDAGHYHVPLLMSPWAYSTYRGS